MINYEFAKVFYKYIYNIFIKFRNISLYNSPKIYIIYIIYILYIAQKFLFRIILNLRDSLKT